VAAQRFGADAVMLTCSSIAPAIEAAALMVDIPLLRVDEAMVDRAIAQGRRVGVAATAPTTLGPTTDLVRARAKAEGYEVTVDAVLCRGAHDALFAGDIKTHDRIVRDTLEQLMARDAVVVLAQASMARVADTIPQKAHTVPILTSPRLELERAREVLA
jgi:Asp/Glu/hydantoin racemase